ncbi:CX3C chemokine receptor 1-like [Hydractinia symbiolongicarpus]|uniref:CX3C chemokine receptor 1-like n=1 Tax=Hydractinia symbiolongicarpus TaxID=13093 RepID=UPI00254A0A48|nr:CX3C chemokine receptor 1-like [Hydractinia symbiolongicarpus]
MYFRMTNNSSDVSPCRSYMVLILGVSNVGIIEKGVFFSAYTLVSVLTFVLNAVVIKTLLKRKRAKSDNLFLILSISDFLVGAVALPVLSLEFIVNDKLNCLIQPWIATFSIFPFSFSWVLTILISIDRYVAILLPRIHRLCKETNFTYKCVILVFFFVVSFATAYGWKKKEEMSLLSNPETHVNIFTIAIPLMELVFLIFTSFLHLHLYISVRRKTRKMDASRHTNSNSQRKLTITITLMFFCAVILNIPLFVFSFYELFTSRSTWKPVVMYRGRKWTMLITFTNSFCNSIILMRSSSFKKT